MTSLHSPHEEDPCVKGHFYCICRILRNLLLPAESSEPRQVVGMIHPVANGDNFFKALNLDSHDLRQIVREIVKKKKHKKPPQT